MEKEFNYEVGQKLRLHINDGICKYLDGTIIDGNSIYHNPKGIFFRIEKSKWEENSNKWDRCVNRYCDKCMYDGKYDITELDIILRHAKSVELLSE